MMVWSDLSSAGLIDQTFNTASSTTRPGTLTPTSTPSLAAYFPTARITSNYVYVWSGGISQTDGRNYFGLAAIGQIASGWQLLGAGGARPEKMTVIQAYTIDLKVDDGMPHTGKVTATELYGGAMYATYTTGSGGPNVCSDRPSGAGPQIYALDVNYGSGTGCALSFAFQ